MRIHFICRGNAFRSRLAEAYLKSLQVSGIEVKSSGTVANESFAMNGPMPPYTKQTLEAHDILSFAKPTCEQLTSDRISSDDIAIFISDKAFHEAKSKDLVPNRYFVWTDLPDTGEEYEGRTMPLPNDEAVNLFAEQTYQKITNHVDELLKELS